MPDERDLGLSRDDLPDLPDLLEWWDNGPLARREIVQVFVPLCPPPKRLMSLTNPPQPYYEPRQVPTAFRRPTTPPKQPQP